MFVNMFIFLFMFIVLLLFYNIEISETKDNKRSLTKDGFIVLHDELYGNVVDYPNEQFIEDVLEKLPNDYVFIDYIYKIRDSALYTFHRDVTSSKNIFKTKYPVYTLILYKANGCLLSVCPGSHDSYPFVWSRIVNINGKKGTAVLFDSDLLHCGCVNGCKVREVVQYKICHKADLETLKSLQGVRMEKNQVCNDSVKNKFLRKFSYHCEFPINYFLSPFMMKKYEEGTYMRSIQKLCPVDFYNNA